MICIFRKLILIVVSSVLAITGVYTDDKATYGSINDNLFVGAYAAVVNKISDNDDSFDIFLWKMMHLSSTRLAMEYIGSL